MTSHIFKRLPYSIAYEKKYPQECEMTNKVGNEKSLHAVIDMITILFSIETFAVGEFSWNMKSLIFIFKIGCMI